MADFIDLFETCGMKLHKRCSNHPQLLEIMGNPESYNFSQIRHTKALPLNEIHKVTLLNLTYR